MKAGIIIAGIILAHICMSRVCDGGKSLNQITLTCRDGTIFRHDDGYCDINVQLSVQSALEGKINIQPYWDPAYELDTTNSFIERIPVPQETPPPSNLSELKVIQVGSVPVELTVVLAKNHYGDLWRFKNAHTTNIDTVPITFRYNYKGVQSNWIKCNLRSTNKQRF